MRSGAIVSLDRSTEVTTSVETYLNRTIAVWRS